MSALTYAVSVEIVKSFPGYNRGVVVAREEVEQACEEISELVGECCGGEARWEVLSETHPRLELFPAQ